MIYHYIADSIADGGRIAKSMEAEDEMDLYITLLLIGYELKFIKEGK